MKRFFLALVCLAAFLAMSSHTHAATPTDKPVINKISDNLHGAYLTALSDNGKWAVGYGKSILNPVYYSFPIYYNVETQQLTRMYTEQEGETISRMMACDITDDGSIIAGQYNSMPALYYPATGQWKMLPVADKRWDGGEAAKITPDGKYAFGTVERMERVQASICFWDLTGPEPVEIPLNLPKPISLAGFLNNTYQQIYATELATNGKSFTGLVMFSFSGETWSFIYSLEQHKWIALGYDVQEVDDNRYVFTPSNYKGYSINGGTFIHGSHYFQGNLRNKPGYRWYLDPTDFSISEGPGSQISGFMDLNGTSYGSEEVSYVARNWIFKHGNYWYDWRDVCKQIWNIDWQEDVTRDDYGLSGTFVAVSDDGLVVVADDYSNSPYDSFVIQLPEPLCDVAPRIDLLANRVVTPVDGASFGTLREVSVKFDRDIEILSDYNTVTVVDSNNQTVARSISLDISKDDPQTVVALFRNLRLNPGEVYTVIFPEACVCIKGDKQRTNTEVRSSYTGRPNAPIQCVAIAPESGSKINRINANSNPLVLTFDTELTAVQATATKNPGRMMLYLISDDGDREEIAQLSGSISGNVINVYPVMEERLAYGSEYQVVIEPNTLCDISGSDPNEEIVINYSGNYTIPDPGRILLEDDFNSGLSTANWMIYDGDGNSPNEAAASWGFSEDLPWWLVRDSMADTDMAAASHSMYTPAGQSDDWLVTQGLYIADDTVELSFKGQGYKKNRSDKLKVIVYATEDVITSLTPSIVNRFRYEGDVIFNEVLSPGANEETTKGEWTDYAFSLKDYAGKTVYIAFVNENYNQSAVFIDDVKVERDLKISLSNLTPSSIYRAEETQVKGLLSIESLTDSYTGYELRLKDADGNLISSISNPTETLNPGWKLEFSFPQTLPLKIGKTNSYVLEYTVGDREESYTYQIMDLASQTTPNVIIEEYTGQSCPNCPLGHAALEWIEQDFPGRVFPLTIHTYPGDTFATPQAAALQSALGLDAAPTGRVNRKPVSSPMYISNQGEYTYKNSGLWYDQVVEELSWMPPADITISEVEFDGQKYSVHMNVRFALDMTDQNVNILTLVCEDGLKGTQDNNRYNEESPILREWGKGGQYGNPSVNYVYNDVVRTWAGSTFNGTGGFIPSSVEGGKIYTAAVDIPMISRISNPQNTHITAVLIDAETGLVINADRKPFGYSGIKSVSYSDANIDIQTAHGIVTVTADSDILTTIHAIDGTTIAKAKGNGQVDIALPGYHGIAIVNVTTPASRKSIKIAL
ncbi:MAG: choice-of-anchor J domain-containing protein [Muribaculum sp.]|nr:choice-of-anchor J domain-containing protein [Muribaculum sp.]